MDEQLETNVPFSSQSEQFIKSRGLIPIRSTVQNVFDQVSKAADANRGFPGLSTGLEDLDRLILGLDNSELVMIAGCPEMGKTALAMSIAAFAGLNCEKNVAIFALELSKEQLVSRLLSRLALIPFKYLKAGILSDRQWRDFADASQLLSASSIHIDDTPLLTVSDMVTQCRRIQNLGLVVIDSFQLIQSAGSSAIWSCENADHAGISISRTLKIMARELNVPVVCTSELSRTIEFREDKRPMLSDLHDTGVIEQYIDVVIGLYRGSYYSKEHENPNSAEAIILKNPKGSTGTVPLTWFPDYMSFSSIERCRYKEYEC